MFEIAILMVFAAAFAFFADAPSATPAAEPSGADSEDGIPDMPDADEDGGGPEPIDDIDEGFDEKDEPIPSSPDDTPSADEPSREGAPAGKPEHPEAQPSRGRFDDELLNIAHSFDMTPQEIQRCPDSRSLENECMRRGQEQEAKHKAAEEAMLKVELPADGEFDPEFQKAFTHVADHYNKHVGGFQKTVAELQQTVQNLQKQEQARNWQAFTRDFDKMIDDLGVEYEEDLGKGPSTALSEGSKERAKRNELVQEFMTLAQAYSQRSDPMPSQEELFRRARFHVLGETAKSVSRKELAAKVRDMKGRFVSRPTNARRSTVSSDPTKNAVANVRKILREAGMDEEG